MNDSPDDLTEKVLVCVHDHRHNTDTHVFKTTPERAAFLQEYGVGSKHGGTITFHKMNQPDEEMPSIIGKIDQLFGIHFEPDMVGSAWNMEGITFSYETPE